MVHVFSNSPTLEEEILREDMIEKLELFSKKLYMFSDTAIDAINFPSANNVFYIKAAIIKNPEYELPDNLPIFPFSIH